MVFLDLLIFLGVEHEITGKLCFVHHNAKKWKESLMNIVDVSIQSKSDTIHTRRFLEKYCRFISLQSQAFRNPL